MTEISQYGLLTLIRWIAVYPLSNSIRPISYWALLDDLEEMTNQEKENFEEMHGHFKRCLDNGGQWF